MNDVCKWITCLLAIAAVVMVALTLDKVNKCSCKKGLGGKHLLGDFPPGCEEDCCGNYDGSGQYCNPMPNDLGSGDCVSCLNNSNGYQYNELNCPAVQNLPLNSMEDVCSNWSMVKEKCKNYPATMQAWQAAVKANCNKG